MKPARALRLVSSALGPLSALALLGACTPEAIDVCAGVGQRDAGGPVPHADWMNSVMCQHSDRTLTLFDVCWPRSHDAGNYTESSCLFPGGSNACNSRTQKISFGDQLAAGARAFDVRVQRVSPGDFGVVEVDSPRYYTHHTIACGELGCLGAPFDDVLGQLRVFLDHHREVVILELSHMCRTGADDAGLLDLVSTTLGPRLYREPLSETRPLIARPLESMLPASSRTGVVVVIYEGAGDDATLRQAGRFDPAQLPVNAGWSNVHDLALLRADQLARFATYAPDGSQLYELSWTLTQDTTLALACATDPTTATSIQDLAVIANADIAPTIDSLVMSGEIHSGRIPNVISIDAIDDAVTEQCLRLTELNLQ